MANEKRLIDANALKERAIRVSTVKEMGNKAHCYIKAVGTHEIDKAPTVDAVEVVRCKDCRMLSPDEIRKAYNAGNFCMRTGLVVHDEDFCSYGERRTGCDVE